MHEQLRIGAYAVLIFGLVLLLASLFADPLAIGQPGTGFGWKQLTGSAVGLVIATLGVLLIRRTEQSAR
jgi:hypothetical protein